MTTQKQNEKYQGRLHHGAFEPFYPAEVVSTRVSDRDFWFPSRLISHAERPGRWIPCKPNPQTCAGVLYLLGTALWVTPEGQCLLRSVYAGHPRENSIQVAQKTLDLLAGMTAPTQEVGAR